MRTQVIQDYNGLPTGVFISIQDWENIKKQYPNIEQVDLNNDIPQWQKNEAISRLEIYKSNSKSALDFDQVMDEIEKDL